MLEVICLDARDAEQAQEGGADRIELVADPDADGLTPPVPVLRAVLAATDLPVRVMLRDNDSFAPADLDALCGQAAGLIEAGAREFVLGFLDPAGAVDVAACRKLVAELDGLPWTFHRAVDHAADFAAAFATAAELGCDTVLGAGAVSGVVEGLANLRAHAGRYPGVELLAGGGLREQHVAGLREAGVRAFHVGRAVRPGEAGVRADAVRRWAGLVHG